VNTSHRNQRLIREVKYCLDGIQQLQDDAEDVNEMNPSHTNDCLTMRTDSLECVSRDEHVNDSRKDGENLGHRRNPTEKAEHDDRSK
jgi:hypothetical protein